MESQRTSHPCPFIPSSCAWLTRPILQLGLASFLILGMMPFATMGLLTAHAAAGNSGGRVAHKTPCQSHLGGTSAFDGTYLWYACDARVTDLYRTTLDGAVTASYTITGGLGALLYDAERNGIWAGWTGRAAGAGTVRFIFLDASKNVVGSAEVHTMSDAAVCGRATGLAYNGLTDTLYISDECPGMFHIHPAELLSSDPVNTMVKPESRMSIHVSGKIKGSRLARSR